MKKFPKIIAALLLVSLLCGIVAVSVAATGTEGEATVNQLKPTGATNLYAASFDKGENTYKRNETQPYGADYELFVQHGATYTPTVWEYHENVDGTKSLALVYNGLVQKDALYTTNAEGKKEITNVTMTYLPFYTPTRNSNGVVTSSAMVAPINGADYDYITYDIDIGTDAYAYDDGNGVKTYTLKELADLEKGSDADKALAAAVKANGEPAYLTLNQLGPRTQGYYLYQQVLKGANGWYITTGANVKDALVNSSNMFLSNEVGKYDHLTYVYDLNGDADGKVMVHVYLNGIRFITYKLNTTKSGVFSTATSTNHFIFKGNDGNAANRNEYTSDCYSMVIDNISINAYTTEQAKNTLETYFSKADYATPTFTSIDDLRNATGLVWSNDYVYGHGSVYFTDKITTVDKHTDFGPINGKEFQFQLYDVAMGTNTGNYAAKGAINGKYTLPNGNNVYRIYTDGDQNPANGYTAATSQSDMYCNKKVNFSDMDYYVADFDFASDMYLYNGKYYTIDDVAALKTTDPTLAAAIEKDGTAAFLGFGQFGNFYGSIGGSYYIPKIVKSGNDYAIVKMAASNVSNDFFNNVTLTKKVGEFHHFTVVYAIDHDTPANSACYYFYDGKLFAGATFNKAELANSIAGLKFVVNSSSAVGSCLFDNITMKAYSRYYATPNTYGIDDFLGNGFVTADTSVKLYDLADVTYNKNYVDPNNAYVSLDNVNKTYLAPMYQEVYDALEEGGTLYISGVELLDFAPLNATSFTVVASNGATFTPGGSLVIQEQTTENGITTYVVAEAETTAAVDWYSGDNYLYSESYVAGALVVFNPAKVEGGIEQYEGFDPATGKIMTFGSDAKFVLNAELSDSGIYDAETGTIAKADGYVAFNVELSAEQLNYAMFDAEGNLLGEPSSYKTLDNFKTLYNANKDKVTLIKFYGDGEEIIFVNMVDHNSLEVDDKELTVDLNGQKVWFGTKLASALWNPMFLVKNGGTLNLINGHIYHVARYGVNWNGAGGYNIYTPASLVAVNAGSATLNLGVEGDATKAANFYGTHLIKVTADAVSANVGVYGGLVQSDNMYGVHTLTYCAKAVFDIQGSGTSTIEILDADIIAATDSAVFNVVTGIVNTTVTDSTIITKAVNRNNSPTFYQNAKPQIYLNKGKGSFTAVNSTLITNAVESNDNFTVTLGKNTRVSWPTQYAKAAEGLVAVLGTVDYSETFFMAKNFETIWGNASGFAHHDLFNVADIEKHGYMDLGEVTYADKITAVIADENDLPAGVTKLTYKDLNGNVAAEIYAIVGATPAHPDAAIAGKIVTNNGWYDIIASGWDGEALVTENGVYVATGRKAVAAFNPAAKIKVGANIQGHLSINFYVLDELDEIEITQIYSSGVSEAKLGDVEYIKGDLNVNSTALGLASDITFKYDVTLDEVATTITVVLAFDINDYFEVLVNTAANGDKETYGTGWEKTLASLLQYRYYSYLAAGRSDYETAKTRYEGFFTKLAAYTVDLNAALPELDIDKEVKIDTTDFAGLIVNVDYDIGQNQPNAHLWLSKAKVHELFGETPFVNSAYSVYGYFANKAFNYKTVTPTVSGADYEEQSGPYQFYILGSTTDNVFTPTEYTAPDGTVCYRARIIQGEAANMRATFEISLKVNEETTLVGTYSLLEYIKTVEKTENVDANLKATLKLLYITAVESWNYKVETVTAE